MKTSDAGKTLIKSFEGLRLRAYQDVGKVWTIGYGWTGGVKLGDVWTQEKADDMFERGLKPYEDAVTKLIGKTKTTQNQFDALVSLTYNIGIGNFSHSTVLRDHNAKAYAAAARAFLDWNKAHVNGSLVALNGLTRRRGAERALYMTP